jgi:hypothetical protein
MYDANAPAMDAKRTAEIAESALAAFEDIGLADAAYVAQWALLHIWRGHTNDPADIVLIEGIECRLNPKLLLENVDG